VDSLRGKVIFVLDAPVSKSLDYVADHPQLTGRVMFVNLPEESSMASFRIINDPVSDLDYIKSLISTGFIVRTRADENTIESRTGDYTRLKAAINSGAQVISTDYYQMDTRHGNSFEVKLREQRLFRCNDLLMADTCQLQE
jgi:propanediol dehydratase large subunit